MSRSEALQSAIAAVRDDEVIDSLRELIRIQGGPGQERQMADWVTGRLRASPWRDLRVISGANVVARMPGGGGPSILLTAYLDSPPAGVMQRAYEAAIEDGAAYGKPGRVVRGRGCCTKATLAAMIGAGTALHRAGVRLSGDVILAGTSHDDAGVRAVIDDVGPIGMAIVGEPTGNNVGVAARGIAWLDLTIRGKAVHSGMADRGVNPIDKLPAVLTALRGMPLPSQEGLPPALLVPVRIDTFATPPRTPHSITVRFDRRLLPGETAVGARDDIERTLAQLRAQDAQLDVVVAVADEMLPFRADVASPFVATFAETVEAVSGTAPVLAVVPHGTSAGLLASRGIEAAMFGPAYIEDRNDEEHVALSKLTDAARIIAGVCASMLA